MVKVELLKQFCNVNLMQVHFDHLRLDTVQVAGGSELVRLLDLGSR